MLISTAYIRIWTKTDASMPRNNVCLFLFIRGLSCPSSVQTSLTQNCFKLTIPRFTYNLLPASCGDIGFLKILCLILAWKSGLEVPLQPLGPSCSLQTTYLVGCDSPLQIIMAVRPTFYKCALQPLLSAAGCHTRPSTLKF